MIQDVTREGGPCSRITGAPRTRPAAESCLSILAPPSVWPQPHDSTPEFCSNFHLPHSPPGLAVVKYEMQTEHEPLGIAQLVRMSHTTR